jgi:hypothetical protein
MTTWGEGPAMPQRRRPGGWRELIRRLLARNT